MKAPPTAILRPMARAVLVTLALFWFGFAVLSGAEQDGQGIGALLRNLPNALPWLGLFAIVYVAFRWEGVGGAILILAGGVAAVFFNAWDAPVVLLGVCLPLVVIGAAFIACHYLDRSRA